MNLLGLAHKVYYRFHRRCPLVEFLAERLGSPRLVLDFGGGSGHVSAALTEHLAANFVVADVDAEALLQVPGRARLHAVRIAAETRLPFAAGSFDRIVAVDVLHHVTDPAVALSELVRCLEPDGSIAVVEFDARRFVTRVFGFAVHRDGGRCRFWPPAALEQTMRDLGLRTEVVSLDALRYCVFGRPALNQTTRAAEA